MDLKPPRGTQDLLPPASETLRALAGAAGRRAELYGYGYVETPAFEATELFARTAGETSDVVRKEMYTFQDKGERWLTLRPEQTASVVRAFLANAHRLPVPFRAWFVGPMWRYGRPQAGRLREFRQFNAEAIGESGPEADVEVIDLGDGYLRAAGIRGLELQLNSIGDAECRPAYRDELIAYLQANVERLQDEHRERFQENPLRVLDCKDEACRDVTRAAPRMIDRLCEPCREHLSGVRAGLEREGIAYEVEPTLVRGLDYYTRTAFEWTSTELSEGQGSVGGGGRYDGLAEVLGGPPTPGVGFAIGLERTLLAIPDGGLVDRAGPECFVVAFGEGSRSWARDIARTLRREGISVQVPFQDRPLKAQLRMADRSGALFAAIVGEEEARAGTVTLRRMADGHQDTLGLDQVIARVAMEEGGP